ncbi:uncharacterized protein METZ01_LOCUS439283, partial [marine metagenome]
DTRFALAGSDAKAVIAKHAGILTRYLLFADEVRLPEGGIGGDSALKTHFLKRAHKTAQGVSLREFDLRTRLFKYRCSYMIHSFAFNGLPEVLKMRIIARLRAALNPGEKDSLSSHLHATEKKAIGHILSATLKGYRGD